MRRDNRKESNPAYQGEMVTLPTGQTVPLESVLNFGSDGRRKDERVMIDKLPAVTGSIAGVSSRFMTDYQRHRDKEVARLEQMAKEAAKDKEAQEFERQRVERKRQFEEEAAKKREKRQRRKLSKSSDGLNLPPEVIKQMKEQEQSERTDVSPTESEIPRPVHPYALNATLGPPQQSSDPKPVKPVPANITIVDEE